jgi:proline iminopeptidase
VHGGFFKNDGELIDNAHVLADIPGVIVQGRYDLVCPMKVCAVELDITRYRSSG